MKKRVLINFGKSLLNILLGRPAPLILSLIVTNRCNSRCYYCDFWKKSKEELDFDLYKKIIDEAYDIGITSLMITGGEALLRSDIVDLLKYAHGKGFHISLFSNGFLMKKRFNEVKDYTDLIIISLDTLNPKLYEEIRGIKGGFNMCMDGIKTVIKSGKPLVITAVVSEKNYNEIDKLVDFAEKNKIKISFPPVHIYTKDKIIIGSQDERINNALKRIIELKKQGKPITNSKAFYESHVYNKDIKCRRHYITLFVNALGQLEVNCGEIKGNDNSKFDLRNHSLRELFYGDDSKRARKQDEKCKLCKSACIMEPSLIFNKNLSVMKEYISTIAGLIRRKK